MLSKGEEFIEGHTFRKLAERKIKNMESRAEKVHEYNKEDMEKIIGG